MSYNGDKCKTDLIQNLLPGKTVARKSRRRTLRECTESMEAENKTMHKMASEYQIEKQGMLIPKDYSVHSSLLFFGTIVFKP